MCFVVSVWFGVGKRQIRSGGLSSIKNDERTAVLADCRRHFSKLYYSGRNLVAQATLRPLTARIASHTTESAFPTKPIGMAVSQQFDSGYHSPAFDSSQPPVKKRKQHDGDSEDATFVRRHPLGVRPSGNALTSSVNLKQSAGHFARLPDELIAALLEILLPQDLLRLGGTCRALHAFTRNEELWRSLFVE